MFKSFPIIVLGGAERSVPIIHVLELLRGEKQSATRPGFADPDAVEAVDAGIYQMSPGVESCEWSLRPAARLRAGSPQTQVEEASSSSMVEYDSYTLTVLQMYSV